MQKTGWTKYSSFMVFYGLEKGFTFGCSHLGAVNNHFPVYWAIFGMVTNDQPRDPSASLLLASMRRQYNYVFSGKQIQLIMSEKISFAL